MKPRNTNAATVVLWQGKDGEPGLDVSNTCSEHLPIIVDAGGLHHQEQREYFLLFLCTQLHIQYRQLCIYTVT